MITASAEIETLDRLQVSETPLAAIPQTVLSPYQSNEPTETTELIFTVRIDSDKIRGSCLAQLTSKRSTSRHQTLETH